MKPQYHLRCLGQPALTTLAGELIRIRTKKHLALLVYLTVEGRRSHRRDDLAELLWSRAKIAEARHSLSTALSLFRARLGRDAIEANRDRILLKPGRLALDLDRLLSGQALGDEFTPPLEVAGFLDGFDIVDAPEFALWKDQQHARLLPAIKQALLGLIEQSRRKGALSQIEMIADRMLALDDLSEDAIRAKMEARAWSGDRIAALRIFERWKGQLAQELSAVPSEDMQTLATRLRRRDWGGTLGLNHLNSAGLPTPPKLHFLGRENEHQAIYYAWKNTLDKQPTHVFVLGDSGVGKTTLIQRLAATVEMEGPAIARVQCYDIEQAIHYSTIGALASQLIKQPGASATSPKSLAELAKTVPEIKHLFPAIEATDDSHGEAARIRLAEAFLELLIAVADEQPVMLIIDDFHFADEASLAVLHLILRRNKSHSIMALFCGRDEELCNSSQASLLRESATLLGAQQIDLQPLPIDATTTLLSLLTAEDSAPPDHTTRRLLVNAAAGFPMVLELLLQDWRHSGNQSLAIAIDAMTEDLHSTSQSAAIYRQILQRITRSLSADARATLSLASMLGHRLNELDLYDLVNLEPASIANGMTELTTKRLLRDSGQKVEFINEMIRGASYLAIPSPVRKRLHGKIADRLLQTQSSAPDNLGLEIAWHCVRAGRPAEAVTPLIEGARNALHRGAPHSAERALATALPVLEGQARIDATLLIVEALQEQSRWHESLIAIQRLNLQPHDDSADLAYVLHTRAARRADQLSAETLSNALPQVIALIRHSRTPGSQVRAAAEAASIVSTLQMRSSVNDALDAAATISDNELNPNDQAELLLARAMLYFCQKDFDRSVFHIKASIDLLESRSIVNTSLALLHCGVGTIHAKKGGYATALTSYSLGIEIALRIGAERTHSLALGNAALCHARLGDYQKAITLANHSLSYSDELQTVAAQANTIASAMLGDADATDEVIRKQTPRFYQTYPAGVIQGWSLRCADAYLMLGQKEKAAEIAWNAMFVDHKELLLDSSAGSYARWIARLKANIDNVSRSPDAIMTGFLARLSDFDAIDQLEIILAGYQIQGSGNFPDSEWTTKAIPYARALPLGAIDQLRRMGMLDSIPNGIV